MRMPVTYLRTKVGHRILLLFISCALLPVSVLAVLSFYQVSHQLRVDSKQQLRQAGKTQAMTIYERLEMLDSDLQVIASQMSEHRALQAEGVLRSHFQSLTVYGPDKKERAHWGRSPQLLNLTPDAEQHLLSGNPLLQVETCGEGSGACVSLVRTVGAGSEALTLVGQPAPDYVFAPKNVPPELEFCVVSASPSMLFCSSDRMNANASAFPPFDHASGRFQWQSAGTTYNGEYWKLFIRPVFLQDPWTVVVLQPRAEVLARMQRFRNSFPLVILLSLLVVLLVSMVQVRRTLVPLQRLEEGTRRIGAGHFDGRVDVYSGDEFESLASSFNSMAEQLGRQFHTLTAINEIDQAVFASLDREAIVDGVLVHLPALLAGECFGVSVFDDSRSSAWVRFRHVETADTRTETVPVAEQDWARLQDGPVEFTVVGDQQVPDYLRPMSRIGMGHFLVLPIRVDNAVNAVLVRARKEVNAPVIEELPAARQVADQLAVAFSHVHLISALREMQRGTLTALARAIDAKSRWTAGHSERVTALAIDIARSMGISGKPLRVMEMGGLLHDIGKIGTPPTILDKPGKLTPEEMCIMRDHVRTGVRILEPIPGFREALPIVAQHHEWFNGKGYPAGLAGEKISPYARIFAVADCYDALTSDRPYRKGLPSEETIAMLKEKSGIQFDPAVIKAFTRLMAQRSLKEKAAAVGAGGP